MTAWFYYEVPLYAMFLNLLILPFSSWLLGGGLIAALIYVWMPGIAGWILVTCHAILNLYDAGMRILRLFPGNLLLTGQPEPTISFWRFFVCGNCIGNCLPIIKICVGCP